MSFLTLPFLWLLPLAALPILIHLLNRLRYRTVPWAAMMFLRKADRKSTRRAKIQQWLILAARCLMLAFFVFALSRPQVRGMLSRFLNPGTDLVVIAFDRSASMETSAGDSTARERALDLVHAALAGTKTGAKVVWLDSATGRSLPVGTNQRLDGLAPATSTASDMNSLILRGLEAIRQNTYSRAEIWVPTDRQSSGWVSREGGENWEDLIGEDESVTVRILDVSGGTESANRALSLVDEPVIRNNEVILSLEIAQKAIEVEGSPVPLTVKINGFTTQKQVVPTGSNFVWQERFPLDESGKVEVEIGIPADANSMDNRVAVAIAPETEIVSELVLDDIRLLRVATAGLLPREGIRTVRTVSGSSRPDIGEERAALRVMMEKDYKPENLLSWLNEGGVALVLPDPDARPTAPLSDMDLLNFEVGDWNELTGPFRVGNDRQGIRLDLLKIQYRVDLSTIDGDVLASHADGKPLLVRERVGKGSVYHLSTLPLRSWSNLDAGFIWVPFLQRLMREGEVVDMEHGTHFLGQWVAPESEFGSAWEGTGPDGEDLDPQLHVGIFRQENRVVALNRPRSESDASRIEMPELQESLEPMSVQSFSDDATTERRANRTEWTQFAAVLALFFLAAEGVLLSMRSNRGSKSKAATGFARKEWVQG